MAFDDLCCQEHPPRGGVAVYMSLGKTLSEKKDKYARIKRHLTVYLSILSIQLSLILSVPLLEL